jgi:hypothetical protein
LSLLKLASPIKKIKSTVASFHAVGGVCIRYDLINPPEMSAQDRGGANSRRVDGPASNRRENGDRSVIRNGMEVREFD